MHVWLSSLADYSAKELEDQAARCLSVQELSRIKKIQQPQQRLQSTLGRLQLRQILSRYEDRTLELCPFEVSEHGKPALLAGSMSFNLSHSGDWVAVAVARPEYQVGVDLEIVQLRPFDRLARRYFTAGECRDINALQEPERSCRFYQYWTLREAWLKARGIGLRVGLDGFGFTFGDDGEIFLHDEQANCDGLFWSRCLPGGVCLALALIQSPQSDEPATRLHIFRSKNGGACEPAHGLGGRAGHQVGRDS